MTHGDVKRGGRHGDEGLAIGRKGLQPIFDFLDQSGEQPFFIWYAPFLPHTPHNPPRRLLAKYENPQTPIQTARYQAMCEWMDETCGQLLARLDEKRLREKTLVVYVCDNGWIQNPAAPGYAARSKRSPYDGGVRTPILLSWPGHIRPGRHATLASSIDLVPTILSACGVDVPKNLPGENLLAVCDGKPIKRDTVFGEIFEHDVVDVNDPAAGLLFRWCVHERWKLIVPNSDARAELYDVVDDPWERKDLAGDNARRVADLRTRIDHWWPAKTTKGR
jgi:uncharacterized sulfatase